MCSQGKSLVLDRLLKDGKWKKKLSLGEMQYGHLKHMAESSFKVSWPPWVPSWKDAGFGMAKKLKKTECLSGNQEHVGNIPECWKFLEVC